GGSVAPPPPHGEVQLVVHPSALDRDRSLTAPPDLCLDERQERALGTGGIRDTDGGLSGPANLGMLRVTANGADDAERELREIDAFGEQFERAGRPPARRDHNSWSAPDATRPASTNKRRIASIRSASYTMPRSINVRCASVMDTHRFSRA